MGVHFFVALLLNSISGIFLQLCFVLFIAFLHQNMNNLFFMEHFDRKQMTQFLNVEMLITAL